MGENCHTLRDFMIDEILTPVFIWLLCINLAVLFPIVWLWFRHEINKEDQNWNRKPTIEEIFKAIGYSEKDLKEYR